MAIHTLRPLLEGGWRDGELYCLAAKSYRLMGQPVKSMELVTKAVDLSYESSELDLERGLALYELGRLEEAEPLLVASPTVDALAALAQLHLERFENSKALEDLDAWSSLDPENPLPHLIIGDTWARAQDHEKAARAFRLALEHQPDHFEARVRLGATLIELAQLNEAAEILRHCHEERPDVPDCSLLLARCESELGNVGRARELLQELVKLEPNLPAALVELAKMDLDDAQDARAAELLDRAVTLDPVNDSAHYNLSLALNQLHRVEEAARHMDRSRELQESRRRLSDLMDHVNADPSDTEASCDAAEILIGLNQPQQAAALFAAVLARSPKNAKAIDGMQRLSGQPSPGANRTR